MYGHTEEEEESIYDEWGYHESVDVTIDFLLPTGIYIPLDVPRTSTIKQVKELLWREAVHHPLFNKLTNADNYLFQFITNFGIVDEIADESKHLSECDLIHDLPCLRLVRCQGNIQEKIIVQEIHQLAGIKSENNLTDIECVHFRKGMREMADDVAMRRDALHWKDLLEQYYPPTIIQTIHEQTHYIKDMGLIHFKYNNMDMSYTIRVNPYWVTGDLTREALETLSIKSKFKFPSQNPDDYVLKGTGNEFIIGHYQLYQFKCLQGSLVGRKERREVGMNIGSPTLTLLHVGVVRGFLPGTSQLIVNAKKNVAPPVPEKRRQDWSVWQIDTHFRIKLLRVGNINVDQEKEKRLLLVHMGLYHGTETLCSTVWSSEPKKEMTGNEYVWEQDCFFEINTCNLPRNSKVCITICATNRGFKLNKTRKNKLESNTTPLAWVNMNVFDYRAVLKTGLIRLNTWTESLSPENLDSNCLNPHGLLSMNSDGQSPFIEILMTEYNLQNMSISYPPLDKVLEEAARQANISNVGMFQNPARSHLPQLQEILEKDRRFDDLFDNEKELLWRLRLECRDRYPEQLPKVLMSAKWNDYHKVAEVQAMLCAWPPLESERALELLDCQFADENVRNYAVKCLHRLGDNQLRTYLMQLVQVLKFDSYLNSNLVEFILDRAWKNRTIGHFLFYLLNTEIENGKMVKRFSLILEAYFYGNISHMKCLYRQYEALNKMKTMNERVKGPDMRNNDVKTVAKKALQDTANQPSFLEALTDVECPLQPNNMLEELKVGDCKVMNSKMRPLWLVFRNRQVVNKDAIVIYKNGDDLRQDMLTLQIISIMDELWKSEGLDLRMIPYGCLSTGKETGMIEVVMEANTVANIQKKKAGKVLSAFRHQSLLEWIEDCNKTKLELEQAIENFTYSCAGYCVATYVLGVGDRHSDNIMITEKGQLFHIDFGHILGNFKSKYGIKRERVPFVLAHDFVHVINKGKTNAKEEFQVFRKYCDNAFLILRRQGYLFITLFALMLHSGLPELTSLEHLEYLRDTLALHLSEEKALQQFHKKFQKALADAWSTSLNWFFHNVNRE